MSKVVEIKNLSYEYPDGTKALENINLSIKAGEKVAIIGPNGAGKSTLLLAMAGFLRGSGKVFVGGLEVNKKNIREIRASIGSCMDNPDDQLFMPTLQDDVAFGPLNMGLETDQVKQRVTEALATVGLNGMGDRAPHHLSAGQKRAAAIATILSMRPKIITFDEPEGSLDPRHRNNLIGLLKKLPQTLIIATCDMNFAFSVAERVVLTDGGRVIADGDVDKIMLDDKLMTKHGLETPQRR